MHPRIGQVGIKKGDTLYGAPYPLYTMAARYVYMDALSTTCISFIVIDGKGKMDVITYVIAG